MQSLSGELRNRLAAAVKAARRTGEAGARSALGVLAVGDARAHPSLSPDQQDLRRRLRAHGRQLGDRLDVETGLQQVDRLAHEVAYEHWHRMLFARFLAENDLLIEPESGVTISLIDCEELGRERGQDRWTVAGRFAERMLPRIFRSDDPALAVPLAAETRQELEHLIESLPPTVFLARDSLGWTYQFWQAEQKETVRQSGKRVGVEELPAVTQLFTERYMVLFLLHNTVGAWRAGGVLAAQPELAATAASEDELRRAVRLQAAGGYDFSYLRFVRERSEDDEEEQPTGPWRPAAGTFAGWPRSAAHLRVLDPCCGSGHFLVECLDLLARLRMDEERLPPGAAVEAVLRDNLFGLEIDPRCTQIAAFNLALAAWTWPGAGVHRPLPALNLACSGLAPNATRGDWTAMAEAAADAGGLPAKRDLLDVDESLMSAPLRNSLGALHDLFVKAPLLGSLIDPSTVQADLYQHDYEAVRALLGVLLEQEGANDERTERAVVAQGMARAAELLAGRYHLVITNVPYLASAKQADGLKRFAKDRYPTAKADLATMFVSRNFAWLLARHGVQAVVTPQEWLYRKNYREFRERLLKQRTWNLVAWLGEHAFEDRQAAGAFAAMGVLSASRPPQNWRMAGIDVSSPRGQRAIRAGEKAVLLRGWVTESNVASRPTSEVRRLHVDSQRRQLDNPDAVITIGNTPAEAVGNRIANAAFSAQGIKSGDDAKWKRVMWELPSLNDRWRTLQSTVGRTVQYGGRTNIIDWRSGGSGLARRQGMAAWGRVGVAVGLMGEKPVTLYSGDAFDGNVAPVVPRSDGHLRALWCFFESRAFAESVNRLHRHPKMDAGTVVNAIFDPSVWEKEADEQYPNGLPRPYSDDPTQWIFHGHPCGSVIWEEKTKRTGRGRPRIDATVLQVAVVRLLGYRWPAERDAAMHLADEARALVQRSAGLGQFADADGIVCLSPVGGERPAADRLRQLLAAAYSGEWSLATERQLLAAAAVEGRPAGSIEMWLRDHFFREHCETFRQRPFVWHVWDGRRDGFHALVNYHRLAAGDGEGRRTLDALIYKYLGEWIARQGADRQQGVDGAEGRLVAAQDLQSQLGGIMAGEPPYDLFVRWKRLAEQPIGWEPDIDDGVRINIRPFMSAELTRGGRAGAGVLRIKPKITWNKDSGKEALTPLRRGKRSGRQQEGADGEGSGNQGGELRPREDYPWFWGWPGGEASAAEHSDFAGGPEFDGNRWNDLHYTKAVKRAARAREAVEVGRREGDGR